MPIRFLPQLPQGTCWVLLMLQAGWHMNHRLMQAYSGEGQGCGNRSLVDSQTWEQRYTQASKEP